MSPKSTTNKSRRVKRLKKSTYKRLRKETTAFKKEYPVYFSCNFNDLLLYI